MQKYSYVSARNLQNLTDFFRIHSFDLTQDKGHPLLKHIVDVVHLLVSPQTPPRTGNLLVQDAEEPGPDM